MRAHVFLLLVAIITLCAVYAFIALDTALDRSEQRWREWSRAVESWERRRREWRGL